MRPRTVAILVTAPDLKFLKGCTLCFNSIRVGFPHSQIHVSINPVGPAVDSIADKAGLFSDHVEVLPTYTPHSAWIKSKVESTPGQLVLVDPDTHFWESCEDWEFDSLLAGQFIPECYNDFTRCRSMPRLHTAFLWIQDTWQLYRKLIQAFPYAECPNTGHLCPFNPFAPSVNFVDGHPVFWDCCANLYGAVGGAHFTDKHLKAYEHLNSASLVQTVGCRLHDPEDRESFDWLHTMGVHNLELIRGSQWKANQEFYDKRKLNPLQELTYGTDFDSRSLTARSAGVRGEGRDCDLCSTGSH